MHFKISVQQKIPTTFNWQFWISPRKTVSYIFELSRERKRYWKALAILSAKFILALLGGSSDNLAWDQFACLGKHLNICAFGGRNTLMELKQFWRTVWFSDIFEAFFCLRARKAFAGSYWSSKHALTLSVMIRSAKFNVQVGTMQWCWRTFHLGNKAEVRNRLRIK